MGEHTHSILCYDDSWTCRDVMRHGSDLRFIVVVTAAKYDPQGGVVRCCSTDAWDKSVILNEPGKE